MSFIDYQYISGLDYDHLPALVPAGQSREKILQQIVDNWCTSRGVVHENDKHIVDAVEQHIEAGGYVLQGVALWDETADGETDGRRGAPLDLGDLLRMVEERLSTSGPRGGFEQRPDLYILLRGCRVYRCNAYGLRIRPRFVTFGVQFDSASFSRATFGDTASFERAIFGNSASFRAATFGDSASFTGATFGRFARFVRAKSRDSARFWGTKFGDLATFEAAAFGDSGSF